MPGIRADGSYERKDLEDIITDLESQAQVEFGADVDLTETSPLKRFINVIAQELTYQEERNEGIYYSGYIETAVGVSLDRVGALLNLPRKAAAKATGTVTLSRTTNPLSDIIIPIDTVLKTSSTGIEFKVTVGDTMSTSENTASVTVQAVVASAAGNVSIGAINRMGTPISGIETVSNAAPTSGGTNDETDAEYRARILDNISGSGKATRDAIRAAVVSVASVTQATVIENDGVASDQSITVHDTSAQTASNETSDSTYIRIAQRFILGAGAAASTRYFIQHVAAKLTTNTSFVLDKVQIETDNGSGRPSGTVAHASLVMQGTDASNGIQFVGTAAKTFTFNDGAYLTGAVTTGTPYHVVFYRLSGTGVYDGGNGGTANQVSRYSSATSLWSDGAVENLNCTIYAGIPPGGIRIIAGGATDTTTKNAIAQAILDTKAAGILPHGMVSGTATDDAGVVETIYFDQPTTKQINVAITATGGNATAIESAVLAYIGGTDANSISHSGLGVGDDVIFYKVVAAVMDVAGVLTASITTQINGVGSPGTADLVIGADELARAYTTSITVNGV